MTPTTLNRIGWIAASLGLTTALVGCKDVQGDADTSSPGAVSSTEGYLESSNGLNGLNTGGE